MGTDAYGNVIIPGQDYMTASGIMMSNYGDYLGVLMGSGYEQEGDFGEEQEKILQEWIVAPGMLELSELKVAEGMELIETFEVMENVGLEKEDMKFYADYMLGIGGDAYWLPGDVEMVLEEQVPGMQDAMAVGLPIGALLSILYAVLSGNWIAVLSGVAVLVGAWLVATGTGVLEEKMMYIGGRAAGILRGDVTLSNARGFGQRIQMKRTGSEGHRVEIIR